MLPEVSGLVSWPVGLYLGIVVGAQAGLAFWRRAKSRWAQDRRERAGLDKRILVDHAVTLRAIKTEAAIDTGVLLITVVLVPIGLALTDLKPEAAKGLGVTFLALLVWVLVSGTDVARAFLGGVAFRAYVGLRQPFQVGDRVTLRGYAGKVEEIDPFYVRLTTLDDDLVSIPTASLWSEPLVSANAGDRASLCVMTFHLAPFVAAGPRKEAEDAIWEAIQKSVYWDFDKPMQIYVEQRKDEIVLTAKAYVASTYNEPLFKSDVYQAFLDFAQGHSVPLASSEWRRNLPDP